MSAAPDLSARVAALEAAVYQIGHALLDGQPLRQNDRQELLILLAVVNKPPTDAVPPSPSAETIEQVSELLLRIASPNWSLVADASSQQATLAQKALRLLGGDT